MKRGRLYKFTIFALILGGLYGAGYVFYYWDPTRIIWKRWVEKDPYRYEKINPKYLKTNPADLITIHSPEDAKRVRAALIAAVFGPQGLPTTKAPAKVEKNLVLDENLVGPKDAGPFYAKIDNLAGVDRIFVEIDGDYFAKILHFRPKKGNERLVLFQNGFGGTGTFNDRKERIEELVNEGYAVMALNLPGLGENEIKKRYLPHYGWYAMDPWRLLDLVDYPMRYWFTPVVVALNYGLGRMGYKSADMIGFSMGGWLTMVAAALDTRIRRSYPVAGGYPLYLRSGNEAKESPRPHYYAPMIRAANYLEMFVLATVGTPRRQLQVFNRFDRCCYSNSKGKLYEKAVKDAARLAGGGRFDVLIDETTARHKISDFAMQTIFNDMARP
jgi:dienelactone hydrolase